MRSHQRRRSNDGQIVVVAGYQGVDPDGDITTLGRGASDLTAVALAAVLKADGRAKSTPTSTASIPPIPISAPTRGGSERISYDEMLEMAGLGAKVLQTAIGGTCPPLQRAARWCFRASR